MAGKRLASKKEDSLDLINNIYLIINKILERYGVDSGFFSYNVGGFDCLDCKAGGEICFKNTETKEAKPVESGSEDEQLNLLYWLMDNEKILVPTTSSEAKNPLTMEWAIEPEEIKMGEDVIGLIGVSVEETTEHGILHGVIFLSPDGSLSTLTMFGSGSNEEVETAKDDLEIIGGAILHFKRKLNKFLEK